MGPGSLPASHRVLKTWPKSWDASKECDHGFANEVALDSSLRVAHNEPFGWLWNRELDCVAVHVDVALWLAVCMTMCIEVWWTLVVERVRLTVWVTTWLNLAGWKLMPNRLFKRVVDQWAHHMCG